MTNTGMTFYTSSSGAIGTVNASQYQLYNQTATGLDTVPTTFWIGPSDSVQLQHFALSNTGKGNFNPTSSITWSFTTITES
jgi:hypothetical protein